jgi:hypothetical protein
MDVDRVLCEWDILGGSGEGHTDGNSGTAVGIDERFELVYRSLV